MENVAPIRAITRRSRQLVQIAFVIVAGGVFMGVVGLALYVVPLAVPNNTIFPFYNFMRGMLFFGGAVVGIIGLALAVRSLLVRRDNDLANLTGIYLSEFLDDRYTFVRNINKRGLGYIDAVLVGPPGVLVFRIVDSEGYYRNDKAEWMRQNRQGDWVPSRVNPTREDIVDIRAMRDYLSQHGLDHVPVYGIVVFTKDPTRVRLEAREPVVPVSHLVSLYETLRSHGNYLSREDRTDARTVEQIVDLIYDR